MVSVIFIKPWSAYSPGDIAGFDEKRAQALVDAGAAKLYSSGDEAAVDAAADEQVSSQEQPADAAETKSSRKAKAQ